MPVRRPVVQVVANLKKSSVSAPASAATAIRTVLSWLENKQGLQLPAHAYKGESFEIDASEGQPLSVERFGNCWSLQYDKIDPTVPGRIWRTETTIAHDDSTAIVGVRLAVIDMSPAADFVRSVPRLIGDLIRNPGLREYGVDLGESPDFVYSDGELSSFISILQSSRRTRPIVLFSESPEVDALGEANDAAQKLAGLAHVFVISEFQTSRLANAIGKEFSVWNGAIRTYNPGFNPQVDEVTQHPPATREWLKRRFGSFERFIGVLVSSFAERTVRTSKLEEALPPFRAIRQASIQSRIAGLSAVVGKRTEREELLELEVSLLNQQVREKKEEFDLADAEVKRIEAERDRYRGQLTSLRGKIERLEKELGEQALRIEYPDDFDGLEEWVVHNFAGRLILLNRAYRSARKSGFLDVGLVFKCLERLARGYVDARRQGHPVDSLFDDIGVHLERTGDPSTLSQWKEEYFVPIRGKNEFLEWHLKKGSDKKEENTLRIYFLYDDEDEVVVVGHLPSHLTNSMT